MKQTMVFLLWALTGSTGLHADVIMTGAGEPVNAPPISFLDGKSFAGRIGHVGEPALTEDLFVFDDGMFISKECQRNCDYRPGPYWVRYVRDGVQVKAEISCPENNATMVWNGAVKGDRIEGTFTWKTERWYWTVEKDFWFEGKLVESDARMTE